MPTSSILAPRLITLQMFKEVTWGTGAAATAKWMGVQPLPTFKPYYKMTPLDEQRGTVVPAYLAPLLLQGGEMNMNLHVTYEDLLFLLAGTIQGGVSPTGIGPYTWNFVPGVGTAWNAQTYTMEYGYDIGTVVANGVTFNKWSIKGEASKQWEASVSGFYKTHNQNGTLTGAISDRVVEVVLGPTTALFIDNIGATIGTTAFANTLVTFNVEGDTGLKPVYTQGSLSPIGFTYDKVAVKMTLGLLYTSAIKTLLTSQLFGVGGVLVRLKSTSGAKVAQLDFSGVLSDDPQLYGNKNSAQIIELKLDALYDAGSFAQYYKPQVINNVATLP